MPTPSTRTPVRIARGSYSNLNGSVSDLQDGEISYAEDQDKLYIKEGSSLVALTYTPASPAFTGTITGVNLTLSGNLTVNGTQTIINTQTLDVEDKQIEIGKVSSPSDTTADQGGIKLKGATDKTLLWVNATDAWTFNQNIEIASSTPSIKLKDGNGRNVEIIGGSASTGPEIRTAYTADLRFGTNSLERMRIDSSGNIGIGDVNPDGNRLLIRAASTIGTIKGHIMLAGDSATNGEGPQIVFSESGSASENAGAYIGHTRTGKNSVGNLVFATRATAGDANTVPTVALTISDTQNATFTGTVSDSKGNLRSIPRNNQTSAYTLVASDAGKLVDSQSGGWTIPNSVMSQADAVTLLNNSAGDLTITQGSGVTIYNSADGSTGNRTLATRGMATLYFMNASVAYISGAGLS